MNDILCAPFTAKEVRKDIFDMHTSKASEPDGFTAFFYQKLWPMIGVVIAEVARSIVNSQCDLSALKSTFFYLNPKY